MSLEPGQSIGPYQVVTLIGQGGMGEVHRARDTKLDRDVALKVLPDAFTSDPDRLARFEREAKVLASLNHTNIGHIYGLEEADGVKALVLELVEGPTLADRIAQGPIPLDEALPIATQIAEALEAAHGAGVVHRDLKPANIKVRQDGTVKVLDFGLAKAIGDARSSAPDRAPTAVAMETREGVIMGTPGYMSPEQARGRSVDKRTDIWAFGCVLYEMLTAAGPFGAETVSDVAARILRDEPDWTRLPATVGPSLRRLLRRCLEKEQSHRLRDIGDARLELDEALSATRADADGDARSPTSPGNLTRHPQLLRLVVPLEVPLAARGQRSIAVSPRGTHIVYVAQEQDTTRLYLRALDQLAIEPLEQSEGATAPVFSPDGEWVAFFADQRLHKISVSTGTKVPICEAAAESRGASWAGDDMIIFAPTPAGGLVRVSSGGGEPESISVVDFEKGERTHRWPHVLPGAQAVVFTIGTSGMTSFDSAALVAQSLGSGERKQLTNGTDPQYVPTGHLVYARGGSLMAVPFDYGTLTIRGSARPILTGVWTEATGVAQWDFSQTGLLAHAPGGVRGVQRRLVWLNPDGAPEEATSQRQPFEEPRLSPDGERVVVGIRKGQSDLWMLDLTRGTLTRLTFAGDNFAPIWSPDGRWITFSSNKSGPSNVWRVAADGSTEDEQLIVSPFEQVPGSWSPDGQTLAFTEYHPETGADIWVLSFSGNPQPRPAVRTPFNEYGPMFSPDGAWLAYTSDESGQNEVYVVSAEEVGRKYQVSTDGGAEPIWHRDGSALFYRNGPRVMCAPVTMAPSFMAQTPQPHFEGPFEDGLPTGLPNYDVASDGRVLAVTGAAALPSPSELVVTLGWFELLGPLQGGT